jgi:hypothetical protein
MSGATLILSQSHVQKNEHDTSNVKKRKKHMDDVMIDELRTLLMNMNFDLYTHRT